MLETISANQTHGGTQGVYRHRSDATKTEMHFSVFVPNHVQGERLPVVWYLSGLTCTHANVTEKGEFRAACARHNLIFVAPDTSPRGEGVPDDSSGAYDFGLGASFYVNATQKPFDTHYQMGTYLEEELPAIIARQFPADMTRQSIMGHSMGGHGALTMSLRNPGRFLATSAFSPIVAPSKVLWGQKALAGYLGTDVTQWHAYDACRLIEGGARLPELLVDQGLADTFLQEQLRPELLRDVCDAAGQPLTMRMQEGYDHSYYFISTFMDDHIDWHAARLRSRN